jgi:hypothetical protein
MKIEYNVSNDDYLQFLLFTASQSKAIKSKRMRSWLVVPVIYMIIAVVFYFLYGGLSNYYVIAFAAISLLWLAVYPVYQRWLYKRHYRKFINKNYSHRVERINTLELKGKDIFLNDGVNESRFALSEIVNVYRTAAYIFPMIKGNLGIIIPRSQLNEKVLEKFVKALSKSSGVAVTDLEDWKWK